MMHKDNAADLKADLLHVDKRAVTPDLWTTLNKELHVMSVKILGCVLTSLIISLKQEFKGHCHTDMQYLLVVHHRKQRTAIEH